MATTVITATTRDIVLKSVKIILNDEQIKAMPSTSIEILPAPEAGKIIIPYMAILSFNIAGSYDNISSLSGGITTFFIDSLTPGRYNIIGNSLNTYGSWAVQLVSFKETYKDTDIEVIAGTANADESRPVGTEKWFKRSPITLTCDNYTIDYNTNLGDFTGGNAENSLGVTVFYSIIEL